MFRHPQKDLNHMSRKPLTKQKQKVLEIAQSKANNYSKEFKIFATKHINLGTNSSNVILKWNKRNK